jgi:hypothetical protein
MLISSKGSLQRPCREILEANVGASCCVLGLFCRFPSVTIVSCDWLRVLLNLAAVQRGAETSAVWNGEIFVATSRRQFFYNIGTTSKRRPELPKTKVLAFCLLLRSYPAHATVNKRLM